MPAGSLGVMFGALTQLATPGLRIVGEPTPAVVTTLNFVIYL
jgi:hypothetical protein